MRGVGAHAAHADDHYVRALDVLLPVLLKELRVPRELLPEDQVALLRAPGRRAGPSLHPSSHCFV